MFDFLKKKIANFSQKLKKNIETQAKEEIVENKKEPEKPKKNLEKTTEKKENLELKKTKSIKKQEPFFKKKLLDKREDKRKIEAKISTSGKIKSFFTKQITLQEKDLEELLFELELSLLESDVEQDTGKEIVEQIKTKLIGKKLSTKNLNDYLKEIIKEILKEMMQTKKIDLIKEIKEHNKPYKIILLGPNGAGKTTSIAKITNFLQKNNLTCVWAASDTFRSGAIDQLKEHAEKLNTKIIRQQYGADPAAVAFDAIQSAKANNSDVILIDTAGRQETNKNLMEELKKIERITNPNLKIYVGEAYTGQGLLEMAKEFNEKIGIDCFILTKIDTDTKGGTTISLLYKLKKPILFVGTGQEYNDFEEFNSEFILEKII